MRNITFGEATAGISLQLGFLLPGRPATRWSENVTAAVSDHQFNAHLG